MRTLVLTLILTCMTIGTAFATPAWINSQTPVALRASASNSGRIIQSDLKNGTPINVLRTDGGWTQIQYNGIKGFVASLSVTTHAPIADLSLDALQKQYGVLENNYEQTKAQLDEANQARTTLTSQVDTLQQQLGTSNINLNQAQEAAANPLRISEANKQLTEQLNILQTQLDQVRVQNNLLEHDKTYEGWAWGLGTLILGMIIGAWLRSRGLRARSGWG